MLEGELSRVPSFLAKENNTQLWSILYLPQVGYVVQVSGQPLSGESAQAPAQLAQLWSVANSSHTFHATHTLPYISAPAAFHQAQHRLLHPFADPPPLSHFAEDLAWANE